jgi:hypothetical protein
MGSEGATKAYLGGGAIIYFENDIFTAMFLYIPLLYETHFC